MANYRVGHPQNYFNPFPFVHRVYWKVQTNRRRVFRWTDQWEAKYHVKVHSFWLTMGSGIKLTREELTLTQILNMNSAANLYNSLILSSGLKLVRNGVFYSSIGYHLAFEWRRIPECPRIVNRRWWGLSVGGWLCRWYQQMGPDSTRSKSHV